MSESENALAAATRGEPAASFHGALERLDRTGLAGWCVDFARPAETTRLCIQVNGVTVTWLQTRLARSQLLPDAPGEVVPAGFELYWLELSQGELTALAKLLQTLETEAALDIQVLRDATGERISQTWWKSLQRPVLKAGDLRAVVERLLSPPEVSAPATPMVILAGMHRSGTSAMAQALHQLGLWMGDADEFWPPADRWNPHGYFELSWVVKLNDHLLRRTGHEWNRPPADAQAWHQDEALLARMRTAARAVASDLKEGARRHERAVAGFKDPRVSVVWELWDEALPDARWLIALRHPLEIAQSLARRDGVAFTQALSVVRSYYQHIARLVECRPAHCALVCYSNFLEMPVPVLTAMARWCGLPASADAIQTAAGSVSSEHRHHGLGELAWPDGFSDLRQAYFKLQQLSLVPGGRLAASPIGETMNKTNSSLEALDTAPAFRGAAETLGTAHISGWCVCAATPSAPVQLNLFCDGVALGQFSTSHYREDLSLLLGQPCPVGFVIYWTEVPAATRALLMETLAARFEDLDTPADLRFFITDDLELDTTWARSRGEPFTRRVLLAHLQALADPLRQQSLAAQRETLLATLPPVQPPPFAARIQPVAFYLPQFHPTPENDEWWGKGFSEWTQVTSASPRYQGHVMPRRPAELGYYDLRTPGVMQAQIELAQSHGLAGFCFHHYWMDGKRLLRAPLEQFLALDHEFGFCINWANEPWSRRWDGSDRDVLMPQAHQAETDIAFFEDVLPLLQDRRYLKVEGKPILLIYRVSLISQWGTVFDRWREMARKAGLPGLHIAMVESFGLNDPQAWGCDSSVQFPPHNLRDLLERPTEALAPGFKGRVFEYPQVVAHALNEGPTPHRRYPGAMLAWDNTARRGDDAHIYADYEPGAFELWLEHLARDVEARLPAGERYVFINAWNEWSEGSYLEPDHHWGRSALEAVRAVVHGQASTDTHLSLLRRALAQDSNALRSLEALASRLQGATQSLEYSLYMGRSRHPRLLPSRVSMHTPEGLATLQAGGKAQVERLAGQRQARHVQLALNDRLTLQGWSLPGDRPLGPDTLSFLCLRASDRSSPTAYALVNHRQERRDVAAASGDAEGSLWSGWSTEVELMGLAPGTYQLSLAFPAELVGAGEAALEIPLRCAVEVLP